MNDRTPNPRPRMRDLFRTRRALVLAVVLLAAIIPGATRAVRAHGPASLQRAAGYSRAVQGADAPPSAKPVAGVAKPGAVQKRTSPKPTELHLVRAHGAVFDARKLHGTVVKRERPEPADPNEREPSSIQPRKLTPNVMKHVAITSRAAATDTSFEGLDFANWGQGHPPDTNGDVGPTYYIQTINVSIGIYDKSNGNRVAAFTFNSFMSQGHFGNQCDTNNFGDPVVLYDSFEDRWFISDFAFTLDGSGNVNPQHAFQCFAVSKTGDPVNGGWNFYSIEAPGGLGDYPKFGIWPDGIYMSANMFGYAAGASYQAPHMWALNKAQMYAGAPSPQVVDFTGPSADFTVIPANARLQTGTPPPGTPEYFTSTEEFLNAQTVYKFHVDWDKISTSTFTGPDAPLAPTCWPAATPANASTTANNADVLAIRAMAQTQYTNIGGTESLWMSHTVERGESATNTNCNATTGGNAAPRWYQINVTGGTVASNDVQGHTWDPDASNLFFRFMPSVAVDRNGDLAMGYTKSNATTNPQIKYAGRLATDPINTFSQGEQTLVDGSGSQSGSCGGSACIRWGDYSGMALDPNGCEFWQTGEYFLTSGLNFNTKIGSFHFPGCTTVGNGTVSGVVTSVGNALPGATVMLGSRTTTTDSNGAYTLTVPAGTYPTITVSKPGFTPATGTTIVVPNNGNSNHNFGLAAAAQSGCFTDNTQSTFQRGVPANCDLVKTPGSVVLASPDNTAAQNSNVSPTGFSFTNTSWAGQTFTPTVTGQLKRVDVELFCLCSSNSPNVTLSIRNTTGATPVPTGVDLATATLPGFNDGGAGGLKTFTFAAPVTLTAGTRYAFIFRLASAPAGGNTVAYTCSCATTGFSNTNPYANGQFVTSTTSGSTWAADTTVGGRDLNFVTYINPGFASSGTFVSSLKDANPTAGRTPTWTTITYSATTPSGTAVSLQVAASNSTTGPFNFVGPDGTAGTSFASGASLSQFNGFRYLKYRATLTTTNSAVTPTLSSVQVCFVDAAATSATTLTVSPATGPFSGTATLSAHLTSSASDVPNELVSFTLNGSSAGTATTNASGVATVNNASLAGINAGSYPTGVAASFAGDASFDPSTGSAALTVNKADQTITVTTHAPASAVFGTSFGVGAQGGASGNPVTLSSSGACSNSGASFTMTSGTGTCSVMYDQAGTTNYNPAPQVTETVNAAKAGQAINVTTHAPGSAVFNTGFSVAATGGASGNPVTFSSSGACSNTGANFTMTSGTGTCSVKYDQAGDANYSAAPTVTETTNATKLGQTINVTTHAPVSAAFNAQFTVAATGGASGNSVTFSSSSSCSNTGATFTMTSGTGTCSVKYDQAADANYSAAPTVTETTNAQKIDQTISVSTHAPASAPFNSSFGVAASAPGGVISYSSAGSCTNSGNTFTMTSGSGTCTVHYDQGGDSNYNAAPQVTETTNATKASQAINVTTHAPASAGFNQQFTVAATGGASGNAVTFSSGGSCSNTGATFTMTSGSGTCSVHYDQAGDANYSAAPQATETTNATKLNQTINVTTHAPSSAAFNQQFTVAATGGGSGNPVTFSNSGSCTNSGATFTITNSSGTCSVKYDEAGDANYNAAPQVIESVSVGKTDQAINVTTHAPASAVFNTQFTVAATGGGSGNPVTFSSSGSCTNVGATFTMTSGTGTCTVKYDQAGDANYNAAPQLTETVNAQKTNQTISVSTHAPAGAVYNTSFGVAASAPAGAITYTSAGACSNSGNTYTMTSGTGTCTVKYDQAGSADYNAATQVTETTNAQKADQAINVTQHAPASAGFNAQFTVAATGGASGNPVTFSNGGSCSNTGATFTMTSGSGICTVKYDQAGDANYNAAPQVTETVNATKADQAINVTTHAPASASFNQQFTVAATGGGSGNPVTFSSAGSCSNSAATFTMTSGTGTCSVKYDQAGNANYNPATTVTETTNATKASQTMTVSTHAPGSAVFNASFGVAASAPGGAITYGSSGSCSNSGNTYTMTSGTGVCTVTYNQAGDSNYSAAPQVTETTNAVKADQTITFAALADRSYPGPDFNVSATASSGLTVTFAASGPCTVSGTTVHMTGTGSCTITGSQAGSANYNAATDLPRTFQITSSSGGDTVNPIVNIVNPSDGEVYKLDKTQKAKFKCTDNVAIASCVGTVPNDGNLDTSTIGSHAFTVTATDTSGNTRTVTVHYTVVYTLNGFFSPIGNAGDSSLNLVHAGDLIKLGFGLDGDRGPNIGTFSWTPVTCPSWTPHTVPAAGAGTTAGLTFGNASGHYTYGWQTSAAWAGQCQRFDLQLNDGTSVHSAVFLFYA